MIDVSGSEFNRHLRFTDDSASGSSRHLDFTDDSASVNTVHIRRHRATGVGLKALRRLYGMASTTDNQADENLIMLLAILRP